jgi:hypothetical protein
VTGKVEGLSLQELGVPRGRRRVGHVAFGAEREVAAHVLRISRDIEGIRASCDSMLTRSDSGAK